MSCEAAIYDIPSSGVLSRDASKLIDLDIKYVHQFLERKNVSAESMKEDLKHLEDWYSKQPHLPDDPLLKRRFFQTLFATDWNIEKTKVKVDSFYSLRNKYPDVLRDRDTRNPELANYLREPYVVVLPKMHRENQRVVIMRLPRPIAFNVLAMCKMLFTIVDYRFINDVLVDEHWIFDCKHTSLTNVMAWTTHATTLFNIWGKAYATKVKGIHWVNVPSYAEPLIDIVKKTVKKKIVERIHIYSKLDELFEVFPKSMFPSDYGGEEKSCEEISNSWADTLQSPELREWFISQDDIRTDESKRIGRSDFYDADIFGVDGSFKNLAID